MSEDLSTYRGRLLWAMKKAEKTNQSALAREVGIKPQSVQHLLDPAKNAHGSSHTTKLAVALGVSPRWLETGEGTAVAMLIDGQHRWFSALKDLDPKKVLLEALNIQAADPSAFESEEARARRTEEEALLAAFRNLPSSERRELVRDVTARAEQLEEMVSRYLRERDGDSSALPTEPASGDMPPNFGEKLGGESQLGALEEATPKKTPRKK